MTFDRGLAVRLCVIFVVLLITRPAAAQPSMLSLDDFVRDWRISKQFTLAVARAMPEASYDFKATPKEMSFGDMMMHVSSSLFDRFSEISGEKPTYGSPPGIITKDVALDWIDKSFDYVIRVLPKLTDKQLTETKFPVNFEGRPGPDINGRDMMMNMFIHVAHHRAQCQVYLRLKGITPPIYTF